MSKYKIKDLAVEVSQRIDDPKTSGYDRFVGLEHYDSGEVMISRYGRTDNLDSSVKEFKSGDILIARRNVYLKRAGLADFNGVTSGDSIVIRAKNETVKRLLPFVFNTKEFWDFANQFADGSMSKRLSPKLLMEYETELPDTDEQKTKLADLLWSVYETMTSYKELLRQSDELVKSRFIEMFGNLKDTVRLGDCCDVHARIGWQALTTKEHRPTGDYMLITGTDFKDNEIDYSTCVYVEKDRYEMDPHIILKNDDVLITKDGTIGKVAIVHNLPKPATLNGGVFVVRPDERFNKEYIAYVFKGPLFEEYVEKSKTGATIKHLNQKHLVEFNIPVPSIDKQVEFAKFAQQIDKSKFILQENISKLETVYKKIMNRYLKKED